MRVEVLREAVASRADGCVPARGVVPDVVFLQGCLLMLHVYTEANLQYQAFSPQLEQVP